MTRVPCPRSIATLVAPADVVIDLDPKGFTADLLPAMRTYLAGRPEGGVTVAFHMPIDGAVRELRFGRRVDGIRAGDVAAILGEHRREARA